MKYNKLVRDGIPDVIVSRGEMPVTKILVIDSYKTELRKKLQEEVAELSESGRAKELADILEVTFAIAKSEGVSESQLEEIRKQKLMERGGFEKRIFLIETQPSGVQ